VSILSEIVSTGPLRRFTDEQESGPFASWKHEHIFEEGVADIEGARSGSRLKPRQSGTWVRDRVQYSLPLGPLGAVAHWLQVRRELENLFAFRRERLRERFAL
jgi:ligand-binding SRPBCC domain-containing protein